MIKSLQSSIVYFYIQVRATRAELAQIHSLYWNNSGQKKINVYN